jgi:hypothetical protein
VDFSKARDLFVIIFRISDLSEKIMDRGLISEKPRGLSGKSARSGPRVDFTRIQGPLCKILEITRITNYFPTVNLVHQVHARWIGAGRAVRHGPMVARTEGTAARSPELGLRPLRCDKAHERGPKRGRGARRARLGPHRSVGGAVAIGRRQCRTGRGGAR